MTNKEQHTLKYTHAKKDDAKYKYRQTKNEFDFEIEENGNELMHQPKRQTNQVSKANEKRTCDKKQMPRNVSIQFDKDMKKYGLDDKIMHIETLKTNIQKQFGPCINTRPNKILFPFQKRNRSSSPPKESPINRFNSIRPNSPTPCKVMPMMTHNFDIFGCNNDDFLNALDTPKEEKCTADSSSMDEKKNEEDSWMYKTYSKHAQCAELPSSDKTIDTLMGFLKREDVNLL